MEAHHTGFSFLIEGMVVQGAVVFEQLPSGTTVEGRPIEAYRSALGGRDYVYLMAGTHGDEIEGVDLCQRIFQWIHGREGLAVPLVVVPILNVDAYQKGQRGNARGVDLNRNYPSQNWSPSCQEEKYAPGPAPLSEPENQFLQQLLQEFPPRIIFSFHSWKPLINYNGGGLEVAQFLAQYNHYPLTDHVGHPTPGSLGEYIPEKYQAPVITFECPTVKQGHTLEGLWAENRTAFEQLFLSGKLQ